MEVLAAGFIVDTRSRLGNDLVWEPRMQNPAMGPMSDRDLHRPMHSSVGVPASDAEIQNSS